MPRRFRSETHGTCLVGGQHPAGSQWAGECPVLRRLQKASPSPAAGSGGGRYRGEAAKEPPAGRAGRLTATEKRDRTRVRVAKWRAHRKACNAGHP